MFFMKDMLVEREWLDFIIFLLASTLSQAVSIPSSGRHILIMTGNLSRVTVRASNKLDNIKC